MELIRIILPTRSPYAFGSAALHDMAARRELIRAGWGMVITLTAAETIDLGIAWGRGRHPPVKLRFAAEPGHVYRLFWLQEGFGAGMGAMDIKTGLLHF